MTEEQDKVVEMNFGLCPKPLSRVHCFFKPKTPLVLRSMPNVFARMDIQRMQELQS